MRLFGKHIKKENNDKVDQKEDETIKDKKISLNYQDVEYAEMVALSNSIQDQFGLINDMKDDKLYSEGPLVIASKVAQFLKYIAQSIVSLIGKVIRFVFGGAFFGGGHAVSGSSSSLGNKIIEVGINHLGSDVTNVYDDFFNSFSDIRDDNLKVILKALAYFIENNKAKVNFEKYMSGLPSEKSVPDENKGKFELLEDSKKSKTQDNEIKNTLNKEVADTIISLIEDNKEEIIKYLKDDEWTVEATEGELTEAQRKEIKEMTLKQIKDHVRKESDNIVSPAVLDKFEKAINESMKSVYKNFNDTLTAVEVENADVLLLPENGVKSELLVAVEELKEEARRLDNDINTVKDYIEKIRKDDIDSVDFSDIDDIDFNTRFNYLKRIGGNAVKTTIQKKDVITPVDRKDPESFGHYMTGTYTTDVWDAVHDNIDNYVDNYGNLFKLNNDLDDMYKVYSQFEGENFDESEDIFIEIKADMETLIKEIDKININELELKDDKSQNKLEEILENLKPLFRYVQHVNAVLLSFYYISIQQVRTSVIHILLFEDLVSSVAVAIICNALMDLKENKR